MLLSRPTLGLFLVIISYGCTYKPEQEFFQEIEKDNAEYAELLNDYSSPDTIRIYGYTVFEYNLHISQGDLESVVVMLATQRKNLLHGSGLWQQVRRG